MANCSSSALRSPVHCCQVHGQAPRSSKSRMAHVPVEPRTGHRRHGLVCRSDHWLRAALCLRHCQAGPQTAGLDRRGTKSDGGLDRAQLTEAFPWDGAPRYLIRDRDRIYGAVVMRRIRAMGIRDKPIAPSSPWQNGFAERLIGSIRRECADHFVVLGEAHLRRILRAYADYYNDIRTHRSLDKDAPVSRPVQRTGNIISRPILGGIHHHYVRG
jgi:Integrase core domain